MTYRIYFFQGWPIFFSSRGQWISHCLPFPGPARKRLGRSGGTDINVPVLARGEQDGFYYRGTVKEEIEVSDGCCVVAGGMSSHRSSPHSTWVQRSSFWFSWWDQRTDHQDSRCLSSLVPLWALSQAQPAWVQCKAAVVYRHRAINSTGKEFVFCVHMSSHRPRAQGLSRKVSENFNSLVC